MELSYKMDEDQYVEIFTSPAFRNAENWEGKDFDPNLVGDYWLRDINVAPGQAPTTRCNVGDTLQLDDKTSQINLDVQFKQKPVDPEDDPGTNPESNAQTGDDNAPLLIILGVILGLAIVGLGVYFFKNRRKNK